ncbi:S24 family peptidase [Massilibacteroides sp.]|uniref:S24 family peptidase n=1 Tax=Massilibacteroides sp. TaxID=2034766 RepID=UPI002635F216|nr:S24 family peptidase [Massilibacteroides sp.]MDD4516860.1 S24 family peptidase [Massilibacteroides sp.]
MQEKEQKISPIKQRILSFAESLGISKRTFYSQIGVSRGTLEAKSGITEDVLAKFIAAYPEVDLNWLLTGISQPETNEGIQILHTPNYTEKRDNQEIILYNVTAAANLKTLFNNPDQNILGKISIPDIPNCDGAIYVNGDSMYPLLKSGDIIAYKEVHNFSFIIFGEIYIISFNIDGDEYITVKFINKSEQKGYITLVSQNPHHAPQDIPITAINAMALVKLSIRKHSFR